MLLLTLLSLGAAGLAGMHQFISLKSGLQRQITDCFTIQDSFCGATFSFFFCFDVERTVSIHPSLFFLFCFVYASSCAPKCGF